MKDDVTNNEFDDDKSDRKVESIYDKGGKCGKYDKEAAYNDENGSKDHNEQKEAEIAR